jgi:hypothetical protein
MYGCRDFGGIRIIGFHRYAVTDITMNAAGSGMEIVMSVGTIVEEATIAMKAEESDDGMFDVNTKTAFAAFFYAEKVKLPSHYFPFKTSAKLLVAVSPK